MPFIFGIASGFLSLDFTQVDFTQEGKIYTLLYILSFLFGWFYFAIMESSTLQATLGKIALGIKVTDLMGSRISFTRATGRYFGKIISIATLGIGFCMVGKTKKRQALHDILSKQIRLGARHQSIRYYR